MCTLYLYRFAEDVLASSAAGSETVCDHLNFIVNDSIDYLL